MNWEWLILIAGGLYLLSKAKPPAVEVKPSEVVMPSVEVKPPEVVMPSVVKPVEVKPEFASAAAVSSEAEASAEGDPVLREQIERAVDAIPAAVEYVEKGDLATASKILMENRTDDSAVVMSQWAYLTIALKDMTLARQLIFGG
jgi:hypothetical protein